MLVEIDILAFQEPLNAVQHTVYFMSSPILGSLINAYQTGIDYGSRSARLTNHNITNHTDILPGTDKFELIPRSFCIKSIPQNRPKRKRYSRSAQKKERPQKIFPQGPLSGFPQIHIFCRRFLFSQGLRPFRIP